MYGLKHNRFKLYDKKRHLLLHICLYYAIFVFSVTALLYKYIKTFDNTALQIN